MSLNALQKALVGVGLAEEPKSRKPRHKKYKCRICGAPMQFVEDSNIMVCTGEKCKNYYLFSISA